jgi:putative photosynthetic complex assembly protein
MSLHAEQAPRAPLAALALIACISFGLVGATRLARQDAPPAIDTEIIAASRMVRFEDRDGGAIGVMDATTGRDIAVIAPRTNGFLRASMRGIMQARKRQGLRMEEPFRLTRSASGKIVLRDEARNQDVLLNAFGPGNAAVFAAFLSSTPEGGSL